MTDITKQPGDGLPPSEPTQDIGAEPLTMASPHLDSSRMYDLHESAYTDYAQYKGDAAALDWPAINYTQWLEWDRAMRQAQVDGVTVRVHRAESERDALVAQLARMQAVWATWPSTEPQLANYEGGALSPVLARDYALYVMRQQLEAARKGEAS